MTQVWKLSLDGEETDIYEAAETLGFLDDSEALAITVFEKEVKTAALNFVLEALYETEAEAKTAQAIIPGIISAVEDQDWVSLTQSGLPPVAAGRFFVHGSHDKDAIPSGTEFPILIDAGMAFGTGHHGTTKGCLVIFDNLLLDGNAPSSVLDLGCGAGILAIAAAKALPNIDIYASDIDPDAIEVTKANAKINAVGDSINAFQADGFSSANLKGQSFDLIFANILAGPLMGLAPEIFQATKPKGRVILSGILAEQAETVATTFSKAGFQVTPKITLEGWTSLLAIKP